MKASPQNAPDAAETGFAEEYGAAPSQRRGRSPLAAIGRFAPPFRAGVDGGRGSVRNIERTPAAGRREDFKKCATRSRAAASSRGPPPQGPRRTCARPSRRGRPAPSSSPPTRSRATSTRRSSPRTASSTSRARSSSPSPRWPMAATGSRRASRRRGQGSPDGRSIRFTLREGVAWHDGKPFSSADVAFSALQVWKPLQNLGREVFKDLEAVETPDAAHRDLPLLPKPTPFQLIRNALPALTAVLPRHLYEGTDIMANPANTKLVGTGPFRFVEHRPGEFYRLERNPAYWETGRPDLDGIVYRVLPDRAAVAAALEADQIQLAAFSAVPLADLARIGKVPGIRVIPEGYEGITYQLTVEINHRRKELADVARAPRHRARDRPRVRRRHDLPRLRQDLDGADPALRHAVLRPRRRGDAVRSGARRTRSSTRPAIPAARTARASSSAPAGAVVRADAPVRRLSAPGPARGRHRRADRQQRRRRAHEGGLHGPRLRPRRRLAGLPQRPGDLDHDPLPGRPARRACRSRTSTATTARR